MPSVMQTISGNLGIDRFEDGVGGAGRRHIDGAGVGAGLFLRLAHGVEHRQAEMGRSRLCRA